MVNNTEKKLISSFVLASLLLGLGIFVEALYVSNSSQVAQVTEQIDNTTVVEIIPEEKPDPVQYAQITESCGPSFSEDCVTAHSGPSSEYSVVGQLRSGVVLKIAQPVLGEGGNVWYEIAFDEWLRYPERLTSKWYVAGESVRVLENNGVEELNEENNATTTKLILVDRSEQKLYAYEEDELYMAETISTGIELTPTPRGIFTIFRKTPTRYMQGPLPGISSKYYDLPGVPWNLYFTKQGGVIHGTYWHDKFGQKWSNGCVNVPVDKAEELYNWADIGTPVIVQD